MFIYLEKNCSNVYQKVQELHECYIGDFIFLRFSVIP